MPSGLYDLRELCRMADVTPRTVHFYIQQGLLPPAGQPGPGPRYDDAHLTRLQLIRRLRKEHLPLAEIRQRLRSLSDADLALLAGDLEPARRAASVARIWRAKSAPESATPVVAESALEYVQQVLGRSGVRSERPGEMLAALSEPPRPSEPAAGPDRSTWERIALDPDVELHIRRPLARERNRQIERLLAEARRILQGG